MNTLTIHHLSLCDFNHLYKIFASRIFKLKVILSDDLLASAIQQYPLEILKIMVAVTSAHGPAIIEFGNRLLFPFALTYAAAFSAIAFTCPRSPHVLHTT